MRAPTTRRTTASAKAPATTRSSTAQRRGRPPKMVFINVEIKATTRDNLNLLKRKAGLRNQGEVLDLLISNQLREWSGKAQAK